MLTSPLVIYEEINYNFSGGKQIAEYIKQNYDKEKIIIAVGNPFLFSSISAYLPDKKIYSIIAEKYISFYSYESKINENKEPFPVNASINVADENSDLSSNPYFEKIYVGDEKVLSTKTWREVFQVFKRKKL